MQSTNRSTRRRLFALAAVLATCLAGVPAPGQRQQKLVPADYQPKTDSQGFVWDVSSRYGRIDNGTNSCFSGAATLSVNGSSFSTPQSAMMTADGNEYVFTRQTSGLQVTRRVKVDLKAAAVRYVEVFHNPTSAPIAVRVMLRTSVGNAPGQALITDNGTPAVATLGEKDTGLILLGQPNHQQLSVVFHLAGARSKIKPAIQNQSNHQITVSYNLTVAAGQTASILHGLAQRRLSSLPNAKAAAKLLEPFAARSWTRDLPQDVRRSIVNSGGISFGGFSDDESMVTMESLGIERQAADVLAVGEQTRIRGTATCKSFAIETRYGTLKLPLEKVAAIAGARCTGGKPRTFLVDGQVLNGPLTIEDLRFTMNSGMQLELEAESLDRLLIRVGPEDGTPAEGVVAMLETTHGDRLALLQAADQLVAAATPWGDRQIPLDMIQRMFVSEQKLGHHLVLRDGSRLFGFVGGSALSLETLFFGVQEFTPAQIRRLSAAHLPPSWEGPGGDVAVPHLLLAGDNVLVGQIDLAAIHFVTSGHKIPVPPNQIRVLRNVSGEGDELTAGPLFEGELWDGGTVNGTLAELVLPVRSADLIARVPLHDVLEIHVPAPVVADTMRTKIAQLIRDLGHPEYTTRKSAKESLAELGHLPKLQLDETLQQTSDPEVRRSVEDLLGELQ